MDTKPMTRDELKSFFDECHKIEEEIEDLPYRQAVRALEALNAAREIVGEQLPGGYYGICIGCDEIKGEDEMVNCGDENLCRTCSDGLSKEPAEERALAEG